MALISVSISPKGIESLLLQGRGQCNLLSTHLLINKKYLDSPTAVSLWVIQFIRLVYPFPGVFRVRLTNVRITEQLPSLTRLLFVAAGL